jgi:hypothetical protein
MFRHFLCLLGILPWLAFFSPSFASNLQDPSDDISNEIMAVSTVSDINRLANLVSFYALLEINVSSEVVFEDKHLIPFTNYLDLNVVGAGKTVFLYPGRMATFIAEKINTGTPPDQISHLLIEEFQNGKFTVDVQQAAANEDELRVKIGTYMVGEFEFHQEANGKFVPLLEINQARIFFSATHRSGTSGKNNMNFLAEFNPIPEEVIHQVDEIHLRGDSLVDTVGLLTTGMGEGMIPFERLQFTVQNLGGSQFNLTMGQIRNPFGLWSDFTSHRNFTTTKNNTLVCGYALKKIELGIQADRTFGPVNVMAAVVHGRLGRTTPLYRADNDTHLDGIVRASYSKKGLQVGASGYFAEFGTRRMSAGVDVLVEKGKLLAGGEVVYQKNQDFRELYSLETSSRTASSVGGYVQADYALYPKLHLYGLFDYWRLSIDNSVYKRPAMKAFCGVRYYLAKNIRWTITEYGRMFHQGFDEGFNHLSTQLEVTF